VELVDLPAYVESPANAFEEGLLRGSNRHLQGADAILMVVDGSCLPTEEDRKIVKILLGLSPPTLLVLNKTDILSRESHRGVSGLDVRRAYLELGRFGGVVEVSAELGLGLDTLRYVLASILPSDADHGDGDPLIPRRPDRAGVADMVRERLLHHLRAELPSASVVHVQDIETRGRLLVIRATIHVERSSQQAIVIGSGGIMIRRIGTEARRLMEAVYGKRVFLDLRVRVSPGWKKRRSLLRQLGYDCG